MSGKLVLLTGASGYIAAHVLDILLQRGYKVRCTVRSQDKFEKILAKYPGKKDQLELAIVKDIAVAGAFDEAVKGVDGIFHTASPFHFKVTNNETDLLAPAIQGTLSVLSAAKASPSVKRVVITSSFAAILDYGNKPETHAYSEKDWNPITYEEAAKGNAIMGYVGSKKLAEKTAWDFLEKEKPHFEITTMCPPMVFGPIEHHIEQLKDLNESQRNIYDYTSGQKKEIEAPRTVIYVDVRDLALAHVLAYESSKAANQRYFISAGSYSWQDLADICHKELPGQTKIPVGNPGAPRKEQAIDCSKIKEDLNFKFRSLHDTFFDSAKQIVEMEKQGK